MFLDLDEAFTNCTNRIKSSNVNKSKDKYLKSIPFIHANLTVYTLPVNLNELENIDTLNYLINYSKIPKISRKQIQLIFNRHNYDYFLNTKNVIKDRDFVLEEDLVNAVKDFLNGYAKKEWIKEMLEQMGLLNSEFKYALKEKFTEHLVYGYDSQQFEAVCAFSERYFDKLNKFNSLYELIPNMNRLLEKMDFRILYNRLDGLSLDKHMLNLLMFIGKQ